MVFYYWRKYCLVICALRRNDEQIKNKKGKMSIKSNAVSVDVAAIRNKSTD